MLTQQNDFIYYTVDNHQLYGYIKVIEDGKINVTNSSDNSINIISQDDIISNYGESPDLKALKLDIFTDQFIVDGIGPATCYTNIMEAEKNLIKGLSDTASLFKDYSKVFPLNLEIRINKSKTNTSKYKYDKKDQVNIISLSPEVYDKQNLSEIFLNEVGRIIYDQMTSEKLKAAWIKLYDKNIEHKTYTQDEVVELRTSLINSKLTTKDYVSNMEDGDLFKSVLRYIKDTHKILPKHVDTLLVTGNDLAQYWPEYAIDSNSYSPFVSEKAKTSVENFFSQSFMFYKLGLDLPELVKSAVEKSLNNLNY